MSSLSYRRTLAAALVLLIAGAATGTAVAREGVDAHVSHHKWKGEKDKDKGKGDGGKKDDDEDDDGKTTTTGTTTGATTPTTTTTTGTSTATGTTTGATTPTTTAATPGAAPDLGRSVALATASGTVVVRPPGAPATPLATAPVELPTGTRVDTRRGEVVLTSAVDAAGTTQDGRFSGGVFEVRQVARGYTQLVLVGGHWAACGKPASRTTARAAKKRKPIRRLWGKDDNGRFQTRGGGSVATVRGTRWLTEDFCDGTRTTVTQGAVAVRSRRTGKSALVRAGHSRFVAR